MSISKITVSLFMISILSACGLMQEQSCVFCDASTAFQEENSGYYGINNNKEIYLQHPFTRVVARCYASAEYAANACAEMFEKKGYVRFHNIPYKTAKYDFLTKDTYPTRRWREHEKTPRW